MIALFELDDFTETRAALRDLPCASCAAWGKRLDGSPCDSCRGAGWFVLQDHPPPCAACHHPLRASRPEPPGLWWLDRTSPISETGEQ